MKFKKPVLLTRPEEAGKKLAMVLSEAGFDPLLLPMIDLVPMDLPLSAFETLATVQATICVSQHAVKEFLKQCPEPVLNKLRTRPCYAIGPATAKRLASAGFSVTTAPAPYTSEALLTADGFSELTRVALLKGQGGRPFLGEALKSRGVECLPISVYQRIPRTVSSGDWQAVVDRMSVGVIFITSQMILERILDTLPDEYRPWLLRQQLLVMSKRIASLPQCKAFERTPWVIHSNADADLCATLARFPFPIP